MNTRKPWHTLTIEETRQALAIMPKDFLPNRLQNIGEVKWYHVLARQFTNILILVLLVATILAFFLSDIVDAWAILAIVIFNGILGFMQEWKAEMTIQSLKKLLTPRCRVIRDNKEQEIDAEKLIPGDIVLLRAGNTVPADMRLAETINLMTDEAALTGESALLLK